ncbi:MAG: universal stress protein [Acidobacteria bacterium]|nr:universal stress protein [Acidobacteriota bacterium]
MQSLEIKRILVPTDLSPQSTGALQYARFFAERFSATLTLLNVDPVVFPVEDAGANIQLYVATRPDHIAALRDKVRVYADAALQGFPYSIAVDIGDPVSTIVDTEQDLPADLVIMATHGLRGWRRLILGSVTERVIRVGDSPVLSVNRNESRPRTSDPIRKILCPINFSDVARASVEYASQLAAALDGELVVVYVVEEDGRAQTPPRNHDVRGWILPAVQNRCSYREIVLRGGAAERVLDCAEDIGADLIVIGAQHKKFRDETVIGTTTERLVRFAHVPVLSVPLGMAAKELQPEEVLAGRVG